MTIHSKEKCQAIFKEDAYICQGCTKVCQVNEISHVAKEYGAKVIVLYHESDLNKKSIKSQKESVGVVGVACILSLISGGFKAKRLGYVPQCVLLDYCGCDQHWYDQRKPTQINQKHLKEVLEKVERKKG